MRFGVNSPIAVHARHAHCRRIIYTSSVQRPLHAGFVAPVVDHRAWAHLVDGTGRVGEGVLGEQHRSAPAHRDMPGERADTLEGSAKGARRVGSSDGGTCQAGRHVLIIGQREVRYMHRVLVARGVGDHSLLVHSVFAHHRVGSQSLSRHLVHGEGAARQRAE